jgi:hypothetical protein
LSGPLLTARRAPCPERAGRPEINSKDYADEGKSYDEALKAALAPMKGKTLMGAAELSDRAFEEYINKTGDAGFKLEVPDDAKSLIFAKAGLRISSILRARRSSIPFVSRMGNLVDIDDLIKHGPRA